MRELLLVQGIAQVDSDWSLVSGASDDGEEPEIPSEATRTKYVAIGCGPPVETDRGGTEGPGALVRGLTLIGVMVAELCTAARKPCTQFSVTAVSCICTISLRSLLRVDLLLLNESSSAG